MKNLLCKTRRKEALTLGCMLLLLPSCVTSKKYKESETMRQEVLQQNKVLSRDLALARNKNADLSDQNKVLKNDTSRMGNKIRRYEQLLNNKMSEQERLNAIINQRMADLSERENTIQYLHDMINAQSERVNELLRTVQDALLGFNSDELSVTQKDGKVYVAMSDKLLFQSGSARVNSAGKEALSKLAAVLNRQDDIDVFIEGHTDNKPINTAQFKDNWDLSVIRATSVGRILTVDFQVRPLQILPCGRGEFMPVDDNATPEGRSRNRRTEIILAPKIDKLLEVLQ